MRCGLEVPENIALQSVCNGRLHKRAASAQFIKIQNVSAERKPEDLRGDEAGAHTDLPFRNKALKRRRDLGLKDQAHLLCRRLVAGRCSNQNGKQIVAGFPIPALEKVSKEAAAHLALWHAAKIGHPQVKSSRLSKQPFLVAEIAHDHGRIDAGLRGHTADRGAFKAELGKVLPRRLDDACSRVVRLPSWCWCHRALVCQHVLTSKLIAHKQQALANMRWHLEGVGVSHHQVIIAGAGPVGLVLAVQLSLEGIDFLILDAAALPGTTSRAAVVHAKTLEQLETSGLADRLIAAGIPIPTFRVRDGDQVLLDVDFSGLPTRFNYSLMVPQDETEAILIERLAELGHTVSRPARVTRVWQDAARAMLTIERDGKTEDLSADYVVGTDGYRSVVREAAGITFPGHSFGSFLLADVHMDWPLASEVSLFFSARGTLVVAPMSKKRFRIVAELSEAPQTPTVNDVQAILNERGPRKVPGRIREIIWGSRFLVHSQLADTYQNGRLVLAGDAAHVHSPAGGQGMNLGIRDAVSLAGALAFTCRTGTEDALHAYGEMQRQEAMHVIRMTDRLTKLATMRGRIQRTARNALIRALSGLPSFKSRVAGELSGLRVTRPGA